MTDLLTRTLPAAPRAPDVADETEAPATALAGSVAHDLVIVVAPSTGRFRPAVEPGTQVAAGTLVGHVTGGGGRADAVVAQVAGVVSDLLARPRQLVYRGQGLAWFQRRAIEEAA